MRGSSPDKCWATGKRRFHSHERALRALVEVVFDLADHQRSTREKCPQRTYFCTFCWAWHLTSLPYRGEEDWKFGWWLTTTANRVGFKSQVSRIPAREHSHRKIS